MHYVKPETMRKIVPLFSDWEETMIWSCLEGCMGVAFADAARHPVSAQIFVADFCFFSGVPSKELVWNVQRVCRGRSCILVPQYEAWGAMIEQVYPERVRYVTRYATTKEPEIFDRQQLERFAAALPKHTEMRRMDGALYHALKEQHWSASLCEHFETAEEYARHGMGFVVLDHDEPVSGASSYTYYRGGIEIEVDTIEHHRRRGFARACAAQLMLTCLDRGLYPSWDAQNEGSLLLAKQLGYLPNGTYSAYEFHA